MNPATQSFIQEATDILETLDNTLLELEAHPTDQARIDAVFRALHTLKGSGAMFGFTALARFLHGFENAFDQVRSGKAKVTPALIQLSLESRDHMQRMIAGGPDPETGRPTDPATEALTGQIAALISGEEPLSAETLNQPEAEADQAVMERFKIILRPGPDALRNGMRPELMFEELAALGTVSATCVLDDVPPIEDLDPAQCYLSWIIEIETSAGRAALEDVFIFVDDEEFEVESLGPVTEATTAPKEPEHTKGAAAPEPENQTSASGAQSHAAKSDSVRVPSHRLDDLMDQLGELVIAQARLRRIADQSVDASLTGVAEEIERLVTGLRDATLSIRMLPVELVFGKFRRVVRDLSTELGKQVQLETIGAETEVDKNVIDNLTEPLVHIVRNSIDHGIESAEARKTAGKPAQARVTMQARQAGGEVLISVTDDGGGLDAEAIRARGLERGLITEDQELSNEQLYQLIFEPGFSTAKALSAVSGRGVGMDAVRRVIEDLRGTVEVKSKPGQGTQVTLRLPLTLAIIDGLLVRVAEVPFILPLSSVDECVELPAQETGRDSGRALLQIRDELVPYVDLDRLFAFERVENPDRRVIVSKIEGKRIGLVVDEIVGQHQTVIKPLSPYHRDIEGLAGSTILGDGSVAMILDGAALAKRAHAARRTAA